MRKGKLKTWAGLVGSIVLAAGTVHAQEVIPDKPRVLQPETPKSEAQGKKFEVTPLPDLDESADKHADGHTVHAAEATETEHGPFSGVDVYADYLFLKPSRNALDVAVNNPNSAGPLPIGTVDNLNWESRSGFRIGAGYRLPGDGWEVSVDYTHLDSSQNRIFNAPTGGTLLATLTMGGNELVNAANGMTTLQYHVIDLDVSKTCTVGESFDVRFFGGGRYAIIDQNFSVNYRGGIALGNTAVSVSSPVDFNGGGLTGGAEGTWKLGHGWGLYGMGRLAMVAGTFNSHLTQTTNSGGPVVIVDVGDRYYNVIPVTEMEAGFCWQNEHWRVKIGYEMVNWFNMVNSLDFPDGNSVGHLTRRTSDLSLDGLAVQLGVVF